MKIAIISDTHDNLANLKKFLELAGRDNIASIIHCGDVTTPETLAWLAEHFAGPIKLACGNMEIRGEEFALIAEKYSNLEIFDEIGTLHQTEQGKNGQIRVNITFVHKPDKIEELTRSGEPNFIFYGHTHKPWIRNEASIIIANPGTLGGVFTVSTFAVLDTETGSLELKRLY